MTTPPAGPAGGPAPTPQGPPQPGPPSPEAATGPETGVPPSGGTGTAEEPESFTVGPGEEAAAAIGELGQGSRRGRYRRNAGRWHIGADYVGRDKEHIQGDKYVFYGGVGAADGGGRGSPVSMLPSRLARLIESVFVPPACLDDVRAAVGKRRAVLLRGEDGHGKTGLAIHLLLRLCAGDLHQIDPAAELGKLRGWIQPLHGQQEQGDPVIGAGYILDHPLDGQLHGPVLQGLEDVLERADARLVLITGPDTVIADELHDYVVDVPSGPDLQEVTQNHLRYHVGDQRAAQLLRVAALRQLVEQQLGRGATCDRAARLADAIALRDDPAKAPEEIDVAGILTAMSGYGTAEFDNWFTRLNDTQSRCFAVALAFFNDLPYDTVGKAARALFRRFSTHPYTVMIKPEDRPPDVQRPFMLSQSDWLHRLGAVITGNGALSTTGGNIVYQDETYPERIIRRAWEDYQAQDEIVGWLHEVAADNSEPVRIVAGKALGLLALLSFESIGQNVLQRWAVGKKYEREAVSYALMIVAAHRPGLHADVNDMVTGWFADTRNPLAQATAARAYGLARGVFDPPEAFKALDKLTTVDDIRVAVAVGDAIADLLDDGPPGFACEVLASLASSLDDRKKAASIQLGFLILAGALDAVVPADSGSEEVRWPYLLHLAAGQPMARAALMRLWQRVINDGQFADEAFEVMTQWASVAEGSPSVREAILRLVRAVSAGDRRSRQIFLRYAALWVSDDNFCPIPQVSAAVQAVLEAERTSI